MSILIKSTHIFPDSRSPSFSGYLLLSNGKINQIIRDPALLDASLLSREDIEFLDFEDSYIFPGLIDMNVHLNSNYDAEWGDLENTTKMAAQGGITTIIDNPVMNNYSEDFNEIEAIEQRISKISGSSFVDFGIFALLSTQNYQNMKEIWDEGNILGFKIYLAPNIQNGVPSVDSSKGELRKISEFLAKGEEKNVLLSIHAEAASSRDMFICSPMRLSEKEKRLDLNEEIKDSEKFGGGIHGEMDDAEDSNKSSNESEEEKNDLVEEMSTTSLRHTDHITSSLLKIRSKNSAEIQDQRAIHTMEMMGYTFNDQETEEKDDKSNKSDALSSDPELERLVESSEEECSDYEEEKPQLFQKKSIFSKKFTKATEITTEQKPTIELAKMFKEKLRTAMFIQTPTDFSERKENPDANKIKEKVLIDMKLVKAGNLLPLGRHSEQLDYEKDSANSIRSDDDKKGPKRPSSLLMRRDSCKMIMTKSVDLTLTPTSPNKKEFTTLKTQAQNCSYKIFLINHYVAWELNGVKQVLNNFKKPSKSTKVLISNISNPGAAFLVRNMKKKCPNLQIFCETSTPYIFFHSEMIKKGQCEFKGSPPIRDRENRNLLIAGLNVDDLIHCVSSFHMQVPTKYKRIDHGNFKRCFNGFSIIGYNLQVLWSKLYSPLKLKFGKNKEDPIFNEKVELLFHRLIYLLSESPAEILSLQGRKGTIKEGNDADLVIWNPFEVNEIKRENVHLKCKQVFLMRNYKLYGKVVSTFVRGNQVFVQDKGNAKFFPKVGKLVSRKCT